MRTKVQAGGDMVGKRDFQMFQNSYEGKKFKLIMMCLEE